MLAMPLYVHTLGNGNTMYSTPTFLDTSLCIDYYLMIFQVIRPYIPYQEPKLSAALYEVVLNVLMGEDCKVYVKLTILSVSILSLVICSIIISVG